MERISLFKLERPDIKISMEIYFNQEGQLIFDGYDIGKSVEGWFDDIHRDSGKIPYHRIGNKVLYRGSEIADCLESFNMNDV